MKSIKDATIIVLKQCKTVKQWNNVRKVMKPLLTQLELAEIDSSGLIVQVLGKES